MGAANSVPLWLNPNGNPPQYDMWGFIPDGLTPPQHITGQMYDLGFPDVSPLLTHNYQHTGWESATSKVLWVGQQNDMLDNFSVNLNNKTTTNEWETAGVKQGDIIVNEYARVAPSQPGGPWAPDTSSRSPTCDPTNYPNCYLSSMRANAAVFAPLSTWWYSEDPPQFENGTPVPKESSAGAVVSLMDRYVQKIDQNVNQYAAGRYEMLSQVCSQDTSAYDPCTTGLFEKILPVLFGGAGLLVLKVYGSEALAFLPSQTNGFLYATTFFTLYHIGSGVESYSIPGVPPQQWEDDTAAAANSLAMGVGAMVASYQLQGNPYVLPASLGSAMLSRLVLGDLLYYALLPVVKGTGLLSAIPVLVLHFVEKFFCWISNWGMTACDDFGESSGFPDARRWDVPSLAAKLTDIACEEQGWERDSEQAKFVYRGLITNPSWMTAATNATNMGAGNTLWDGKHQVNPLGLIGPIHETGKTKYNINSGVDNNMWAQEWGNDQWMFTGNEVGGNVDPFTNTNRYACQNFDILYWADECGRDNDPECQGSNPPPRCQNQCAENASQDGSDIALANNMKNWLRTLVDSAYDPAKLTAQFTIPGLDSGSYLHLPGLYDVATYLRTCSNDYESGGKTGFDTVKQRGEFANYYLSSKVYGHNALQETELVANNMFVAGTLREAWESIFRSWNQRNVTAYAHFVYREKGPIQQADFEKWEAGYTEVRKWKDDPFHVNEGFSDDPRGGIKVLPPVIEPTHPGMLHLQAPQRHLGAAPPLHLGAPQRHLGPNAPLHMLPPLRYMPNALLQQAIGYVAAGDLAQARGNMLELGFPVQPQFEELGFLQFTLGSMIWYTNDMPNWLNNVQGNVALLYRSGDPGNDPDGWMTIWGIMQPTGAFAHIRALLDPASSAVFDAPAPGGVEGWLGQI